MNRWGTGGWSDAEVFHKSISCIPAGHESLHCWGWSSKASFKHLSLVTKHNEFPLQGVRTHPWGRREELSGIVGLVCVCNSLRAHTHVWICWVGWGGCSQPDKRLLARQAAVDSLCHWGRTTSTHSCWSHLSFSPRRPDLTRHISPVGPDTHTSLTLSAFLSLSSSFFSVTLCGVYCVNLPLRNTLLLHRGEGSLMEGFHNMIQLRGRPACSERRERQKRALLEKKKMSGSRFS